MRVGSEALPMIISFGWTSDALLAGVKTVTRREWNANHAARFKQGMLCDAWNTAPRNVRGNPHKIATIRIVSVERSNAYPEDDYEREGLRWLQEARPAAGIPWNAGTILRPIGLWNLWLETLPLLWVVRFEVVDFTEASR